MHVRNEPDTRTRPARPGRDALLDAAADLLAGTTLEDAVGATVGVRSVAAAAGVTPSTVNHHFPGEAGRGPNSRLCTAALHHAVTRRGVPVSERTATAAIEAAEDLRAGDPDAIGRLARIAAEHLIGMSPEQATADAEAERVATLLAAAVAPRSPEAVRALQASYDQVTETLAPMYDLLLEASGRRLVGGIDSVDLTYVIAAIADGFMLRRRFDPDRMTADLFAEVTIRVFESFSALHSEPQDPDPADRLLLPPAGSGLDPHKREAIVEAARSVYDAEGFAGLTLAAVAGTAGVSRATVVAHFGDVGGLAAAVWARFVPGIAADLREDVEAGLTLAVVVRRHLDRIATVARAHHRLTAALLEAVFHHSIEHGPPRPDDHRDPRHLVPLPSLLAPVLAAHAAELRPGYAGSASDALDAAALLTNHALHLCMTRPLLTAAEVAHRICDTTLAGMLRRRR